MSFYDPHAPVRPKYEKSACGDPYCAGCSKDKVYMDDLGPRDHSYKEYGYTKEQYEAYIREELYLPSGVM